MIVGCNVEKLDDIKVLLGISENVLIIVVDGGDVDVFDVLIKCI